MNRKTAKPTELGRDPTTAQLRDRMRSGRMPSKTSARDPRAAPFDTDDEAAGRPAQRRAIEQTQAYERAYPYKYREPQGSNGASNRIIFAAIVLLIAIVAAWMVID